MASSSTQFQDMLPFMAEKLGGESLITELCNGFLLLMDEDKRVITLESLKRNAMRMGLNGLGEEEMRGMIREGDFDGDGVLSEMEFCVLMVVFQICLCELAEEIYESMPLRHCVDAKPRQKAPCVTCTAFFHW
ncbi:Calcium-binding protein PBP1-like protein [Drosera capensis]